MLRFGRLIPCLSLALGNLFLVDFCLAAPGDADTSFGTNGVAFVDFSPVAGVPGNTYAAATIVDAQKRIWVAASVSSSSNAGLGLARLTPDGKLDPTFGSGGLRYVPAPVLESASLIGIKIGQDGKVYVAYEQGNGDFSAWYVCRLTSNGGFDPSFFGGCPGASPAPNATPHDLSVSGRDGSVWILGTEIDSTTHTLAPAVAQFDVEANVIRTEIFPVAYASIDALAGTINSFFGTLYFTGSYVTSGGSEDIVLGSITATGSAFSYQIVNSVAFDIGGSQNDIGHCIIQESDGGFLIGGEAASGINGNYWASVKLKSNGSLDATYGAGGTSYRLIADPQLGLNYAINGCEQSAEGALNMVGTYYLTDPVPNASAQAVTIFRTLTDGTPDPTFGGPDVTPGNFYGYEYPGTVLDYYRPLASPRPRNDTGAHIHAALAHTGSMIVDGVSRRTDGTSNGDVAVMRVLGDDIFNDSLE